MVVDCKNPDLNDLEIELFGHEKNKTNYGKVQVIGKLEQANGGSILLDEIGSTPIDVRIRTISCCFSSVIVIFSYI